MSKRIRLVDQPSEKRFIIETKAAWYKPWERDNRFEYRYTQKPTALEEATNYLNLMLEEDVVLFDSKEK